MKVILSTIGKFHTFDLARQLHRRGALGEVFSGYPWFKLRHERLPKRCVRTFPWLHAPYLRTPLREGVLRRLWEWQDKVCFDSYVAWNLPNCDVFCGLSGSAANTGRRAKAFGAKYVCDRGSSHIRVQDRILREEYDRQRVPFAGIDPRVIDREESEYELADAITVPSTFALSSFTEAGVPRSKLRLAPYGVDLSAFRPTAEASDDDFRVLFVGGLSVRKGVSYLLDAFDRLSHRKKHLTLAGPVSIELAPTVARLRERRDITVLGHVPQVQLKHLMSASHVMVLPSVEEGLALVQAQAMACACPVIATHNTGAADLFEDGREGFIVSIRDSQAIAGRLQSLADDPERRRTMSAAALQRVKSIGGWDEYGETMFRVFDSLIRQ